MRDEHLTFLVLAGAVTLLAFTTGAVPALLLPPALGVSGAQRPPRPAGVSQGHLGAPGALAAQERRRKQQNRLSLGRERTCPGDRWPRGGGFDSRPVADAAASGNRRTSHDESCPSLRHHARGVSLRATRTLRADSNTETAPWGGHCNRTPQDAARPAPEGAKENL